MIEPSPTAVQDRVAPAKLVTTRAIDFVLNNIPAQDEDVKEVNRKAVVTLIKVLTALRKKKGASVGKLDKRSVDGVIAEYDRRLSAQIDRILHNREFQALESTWRGLKLLVDRTDFRENIGLEILNASKDELCDDFEEAPEVKQSGLYKHVFSAEYGNFGGHPWGVVIGNFAIEPNARDMKLLQNVAAVSAMAHAPFIAAAGPSFFQRKGFQGLATIKDLKDVFDANAYLKWQAFRDSENARWVGLVLPQILLRLPYGGKDNPVKGFNYEERVSDGHDSYLWGNAAFAFAANLTNSFAKYRWCANIIGPRAGGAVHDLPTHVFQAGGRDRVKIPTEVLISDTLELELAEQGFIALAMRKNSDNACFFSANSCQRPKTYGTGDEQLEANTNAQLGAQLPYLFIASRLAHYIKAIQVENLGRAMSAQQLQIELTKWINQYVLNQDVASPEIFAKRPLRAASITVTDIKGKPGWYRVELKVKPHFKYMGAFFELSLVGQVKQPQR